jgi:hypothetical protein
MEAFMSFIKHIYPHFLTKELSIFVCVTPSESIKRRVSCESGWETREYNCGCCVAASRCNRRIISIASRSLVIDPSVRLVAELPPNIVVTSAVKVSIDQWNHVAFTYSFSQSTLSLYRSGSHQGSGTGPTPHYNPPVIASYEVYAAAYPVSIWR